MPQVINKGGKEPQPQKPASQGTPAGRKMTKGPSGPPFEIGPKVVIGAAVVAVLFVLFMFHTYVHPFTSTVKIPHKVAPLPGFPDEYPYNMDDWQEKYKQGKAGRLSGVPPHTILPPSPGGQGAQ